MNVICLDNHFIDLDLKRYKEFKSFVKLFGVIGNKIIANLKNKFLVSVDCESFQIDRVISKIYITNYVCTEKDIFICDRNFIYTIDSYLTVKKLNCYFQGISSIFYSHIANGLGLILNDNDGFKIQYLQSTLPGLKINQIKNAPEFFFETKDQIFFKLGLNFIVYDRDKNVYSLIKESDSFNFIWQDEHVSVNYKIDKTRICFECQKNKFYEIKGDVWKYIFRKENLYFISDNVNSNFNVHVLRANNKFEKVYEKNAHRFEFILSRNCDYALIKKSCSSNKQRSKLIFFIHGGPCIKAGNQWDYFFEAALEQDFEIFIPQYSGTIRPNMVSNYKKGVDDFNDVLKAYHSIKNKFKKIIIVGHSYGAFLALKLASRICNSLLLGINGVYEYQTICKLNPKTHTLETNKFDNEVGPVLLNFDWHHIHFINDLIVPYPDFENSIRRLRVKPKTYLYDFDNHCNFTAEQSRLIIKTIHEIFDLHNKMTA